MRATTIALAAAALVAAGCAEPAGSAAQFPAGAPDRVIAGPQGLVGQFVVECAPAGARADDPIVHPGLPGGSHLHQFFGAVGVTADSSSDDLLAGDTTCGDAADTASYWAPMLVAGRTPIEPLGSVAYYRAGPDVDPTAVVPYPTGLMLVAGDHTAVEPQPLSLVAWSCGVGAARATTPPDCTGADSLRMTVTFADCWNGVDLRSPVTVDPHRHVAYSAAGECPAGFEVHIPQLQFAVDYPPVSPERLEALALTSGDIHTGHADFWNTWQPDALRREVEACLWRDLVCGLSS